MAIFYFAARILAASEICEKTPRSSWPSSKGLAVSMALPSLCLAQVAGTSAIRGTMCDVYGPLEQPSNGHNACQVGPQVAANSQQLQSVFLSLAANTRQNFFSSQLLMPPLAPPPPPQPPPTISPTSRPILRLVFPMPADGSTSKLDCRSDKCCQSDWASLSQVPQPAECQTCVTSTPELGASPLAARSSNSSPRHMRSSLPWVVTIRSATFIESFIFFPHSPFNFSHLPSLLKRPYHHPRDGPFSV